MLQEKEIEKKLREGIERLGGRAYKFISPGNRGVPDRIIALPGARLAFVELKRDEGELSGLQKVQIRKLTQMGFEVWVLYGMDQVEAFLLEMAGRMFTEGMAEGLEGAASAADATKRGGGGREIFPARLSEEGSLFYPGA